MSGGLSMPHDKDSANDVMKFFIDKAYSRNLKPIFQEAVDILYRPDIFDVKEDNCGRMLFSCKLCNNDMNSHESLLQHHLSGKHQKNCDKKAQEEGLVVYKTTNRSSSSRSYPEGSLQDRLMSSTGKPIGLQMLEEYQNRGKSYYRCILCGAYGGLDAMYKHVISNKHTEKYIKASLELESSILSAKERDTLSGLIVDKYGVNVDYIKIIRGNQFYPHKWEAEAKAQAQKFEKKRKLSQSPKRSENRSPSEYRRYSPEADQKSRRHRSPSPTNSHYSRGRSSQSPQPSTSRSRYSESPEFLQHVSRGGPRTPPPISKGRGQTPPPLPGCKHAESQKVDLEELMVQLNFMVKSQNMPDSDIKSEEDLDLAVRMMWNISLGLFYINKNQTESEEHHNNQTTLTGQKQMLEKILGYLKTYLGPDAGLILSENGIKERRRSQ